MVGSLRSFGNFRHITGRIGPVVARLAADREVPGSDPTLGPWFETYT